MTAGGIGYMERFKVVAEHDACENPPVITFTVRIVSEDVGTIKTMKFQTDSFDSGMRVTEKYREYALDPKHELGLKALEVGKLWGFEVDFSKGIEGFLSELYKRRDTNDLKYELDCLPMKSNIVRNAIEKELKSRGEKEYGNSN